MHGVHIHFHEQRHGHSNYQWNEDIVGLVELTYVTYSDKPGNIGGEVRPPKAVYDVSTCHEVSLMSSGVACSAKDCWSVANCEMFMNSGP